MVVNTTASISLASPVVVDKENTGLYAKLGFDNICEVDLANATLAVSSQSAMFTLSANSTIQQIPTGITSAFYQ